MKTTYIIALLAGVAAGYFGAKQLRQYEPFKTAFTKGASFGA